MSTITVYKRDHAGRPVWHYDGKVIARGPDWVCLQAIFQKHNVDIGHMVFERGDIMTEWFYSNRYYNVFRIESGCNGLLKGWYCNITRPAEITRQTVAADDLALDVFVSPQGKIHLMDKEEFNALVLSPDERDAALNAVESIRQLVEARSGPFDGVQQST